MAGTLTILFRRDPSRDRQHNNLHLEGYQLLWPDRKPVGVGLDSLCGHGQRLLALGRHLAGREERLLELSCIPLESREAHLTRIPGHRVRRFMLNRQGAVGRIHFLDGTPTEVVFEFGRDEPIVLQWIGLPSLPDGEQQWFDLAARPLDPLTNGHHLPSMTSGHALPPQLDSTQAAPIAAS
jgi:hypothetical protein